MHVPRVGTGAKDSDSNYFPRCRACVSRLFLWVLAWPLFGGKGNGLLALTFSMVNSVLLKVGHLKRRWL